jgi:hypothetical protein
MPTQVLYTHRSRFYSFTTGEKHLGISRLTRVSRFAPWILLHNLLSLASFGDRAPLLMSSFNIVIHVFLGLSLGLLPTTSIVHLLTQSSSPFLSTCLYHLNLFLLHTSLTGSTPILAKFCTGNPVSQNE